MKQFFLFILLISALCSCHHDDEPDTTQAQRTVIIYMAAENNLTNYAYEDLEEMKVGSRQLSDRQNLIVYVDRANATTAPYLARVKDGELCDTLYMPESIAADPTVLKNVVSKARQLYPALSYGLVLWGHGTGWIISDNEVNTAAASRAYGGSTGNNSASGSGRYWMNIPKLSTALSEAMGTDKFAFVMGDCCSFACMETAYELRKVADVVIGSPAEVPDAGTPFDKIVPPMFENGEALYHHIIDNYYEWYLDAMKKQPNTYYNSTPGDLEGYSVPLAVILTAQLDQLATATSRLLNTISDKVSKGGALDLSNVVFYAIYNSYRYSYDMSHVLKKHAAASDYESWLSAYKQAVPYHRHSVKWMSNSSQLINYMNHFSDEGDGCGDVSMFFPSSYYDTTSPNWNKAIQQFQWNDAIHWEQYGW